jgi:hypothetical protein
MNYVNAGYLVTVIAMGAYAVALWWRSRRRDD